MQPPSPYERYQREALRIALSYYVSNGLAAALGLLLITGSIHLLLGEFAAAAASVGVVVCIPPDQPAPKRGKFWQLLPAFLVGLPLFWAVQVLHAAPILLGLLLVPASFLAFLAGGWGKRGLPISISVMFAMVFSMAVPDHANHATNLTTSLYFTLGAVAYLVWATLANALLNARYRVQLLADTLMALATLMRSQAQQFSPETVPASGVRAPLVGTLLQQQAALADQLQAARDILLESPSSTRRQQLADMLMLVLDMRDHLLVCNLDLDTLKTHPGHEPVLSSLRGVLEALADEIDALADALLLGRTPASLASHRPQLENLPWGQASAVPGNGAPAAILAMGMSSRIGLMNDDCLRLIALARGDVAPNVSLVRANWELFVSPTVWSWAPFYALWRWNAPPLRHAIRAALAMGTAYAVSLALPWGTHDYWILLTIVVVLRGSLAQTLERRNSRAIGTLIGCVVAGLLLYAHISPLLVLLVATLAQALAHAFALKKYLVTAVAATVLGLLQVQMLNAGPSPAFDVLERMFDTLLGVTIAWAFSYVLPSWERGQIAALVARTLAAQARHARVALGLWQLQAVDNAPEIQWRLARREAFDSLSALVQATQRSLSEPRAVRPPLEPLGRLLALSYQLLAQLTTVKTMLLQQRGRLTPHEIELPLQQTAQAIETAMGAAARPPQSAPPAGTALEWSVLGDPFDGDLSPWLLRRLQLADHIALQLRANADQVVRELAAANTSRHN
ncbi:FUSC family membrane protein [Rhodoferax sp.]|uniref:FUSC family protein n=1 Tax=Rhodoferax sp. TaxID=50421 RepID=UPI002728517D|nr:FUSC family membrane protein [Rhodoferax sp.]MDO9145176.1 FUSC family membrane protein [Rhodoferax sp.]